MYPIYLAALFAVIATGYFLTTGDIYGTMGVTVWYLYYTGLIAADDGFFDVMKKVAR